MKLSQKCAQLKDNESYQKAIGKLFSNISLYKEIKSGENWLLASNINEKIEWVPLTVYLTEEKVIAQKEVTPSDPFLPVIMRSKIDFDRINGNQNYELELYYAKAGLASWALTLSIIALAALVLFKNFNIALGLASSFSTCSIRTHYFKSYYFWTCANNKYVRDCSFFRFWFINSRSCIGSPKKRKTFRLYGASLQRLYSHDVKFCKRNVDRYYFSTCSSSSR